MRGSGWAAAARQRRLSNPVISDLFAVPVPRLGAQRYRTDPEPTAAPQQLVSKLEATSQLFCSAGPSPPQSPRADRICRKRWIVFRHQSSPAPSVRQITLTIR